MAIPITPSNNPPPTNPKPNRSFNRQATEAKAAAKWIREHNYDEANPDTQAHLVIVTAYYIRYFDIKDSTAVTAALNVNLKSGIDAFLELI
ncbi:MAG: hypothetical protein NTY53_26085 [Kiritimatiellaeota bacterium]|nr:hypothetical protein [Kiritimatiellota bacterium]